MTLFTAAQQLALKGCPKFYIIVLTVFKVNIAWILLLFAQLMSIYKIPDRGCYNNYRIHWCIIISNNEIKCG